LDNKNKDCDILVAKRAEYRRAEAFGEVPKIKSKGKAFEKNPRREDATLFADVQEATHA
jgi:hypothetical protein